jgi:molybdopterin converting factor small subunit
MPLIHLPTPLRKFADQQSSVQVDGQTVGEALTQLASQFPGIKKQVFDDFGAIRGFVNVYVGDDDVRDLQQNDTPVTEGTAISLVPAIAGGTGSGTFGY